MNNILSFFNSNVWAFFEGMLTIVTLIFVVINYFKDRKQNEKIKLYIKKENNEEKMALPVVLLRKQCTRNEIQGVFSAAQKDSSKTYRIAYFANPDFYKQLQKVSSGVLDEIVVPIANQDKFELKEDKKK